MLESPISNYRGRLAPSPTGYLHLGHARTFWLAQQRARQNGGQLILRNDDLDSTRYKMEFVDAMLEDLRWFGFEWSEGPDIGGPYAPYNQSERMSHYQAALDKLRDGNFIYPCICSRKDIHQAVTAPHAADDELIYPGTCRNKSLPTINSQPSTRHAWRFRVPDGETIVFYDQNLGPQQFIAGKDFGDFVVWRQDDVPAYQLACVVDDAAMEITEVVRGADLLVSTARQVLLYRAFGLTPPKFYHCELMRDERGERLAKRHDALSLRTLRGRGVSPVGLQSSFSA
ncbi:MAG TPA: tRNA glutamyl-Q(34) synthetase GluQRS [Candidatus Sulfotelmatobacter sp.]|nr:tRNA glutamyl-Q(34) synthetase GluQRS [Candidatus Sulfotelmatobacter sp.]